jgi:hypothetical protein
MSPNGCWRLWLLPPRDEIPSGSEPRHNLYDRKDLESGLEEVAYENGFRNTASIAVATSIRHLDATLGAAYPFLRAIAKLDAASTY